jgi:serine/threonine protein kinase
LPITGFIDADTGVPVWKLTDFGLARALAGADNDREPAMPADAVVGTPRYMAPEQFTGTWRESGPWTDGREGALRG